MARPTGEKKANAGNWSISISTHEKVNQIAQKSGKGKGQVAEDLILRGLLVDDNLERILKEFSKQREFVTLQQPVEA